MDLFLPEIDEFVSGSTVDLFECPSEDRSDHQGSVVVGASRSTVPAACIACRAKHLKCDGKMPCSRCASDHISSASCTYVRSRRGYKGPRRNVRSNIATSRPSVSSEASSVKNDHIAGVNTAVTKHTTTPQSDLHAKGKTALIPRSTESHGVPADADLCSASLRPVATDHKNQCLEAFFHYFSQAHPFLLPRSYLTEMLTAKSLSHLEAAMRYVGSFYIKSASTEYICQEVTRLLSRDDCVRDGFTVQALLLFAIGLDGNTKFDRSIEVLKQAQDLALELGMNRRAYAVMHGEGLAVMEESWRRTWWELYVVDGIAAGVHERPLFRLNEIPSEVLLPCEEQEFVSGQIPLPHSIEEFEDQEFADDDVAFSSFTYRIAAIRNLGRILQLRPVVFQDDQIIDQTDAYLVNWSLHLPDSKKIPINGNGHVDEMIFQAHMITNACTIRLHRPYSQLDTSIARNVTLCAPYRAVTPGQISNVHAAKIIQAAGSISKLITLPVSLIHHTHFFTCVITLASIVHLSYWAALLPLSCDENLKQQMRLNTGALKSLAEVWPSAAIVAKQVKGVAQEVFASRKLAASEGFWGTLSDEEMVRSMIEDEVIISGFQLT